MNKVRHLTCVVMPDMYGLQPKFPVGQEIYAVVKYHENTNELEIQWEENNGKPVEWIIKYGGSDK